MQYKNAPIKEAVFDIRVTTVLNLDLKSYEDIGRRYFQDYPIEEKRVKLGGQINITAEGQKFASPPVVLGSIFSMKNGNRKIQIRKDGYSFNMLKPYTNWLDFSNEAMKYWKIYQQEVHPVSIKRIALRYINQIPLPLGDSKTLDFDDFLKYTPKIPEGFPQVFNRFFLQMQIPCNSDGINANITQTFGSVEGKVLPFLLDIDVFKEVAVGGDPTLTDSFNALRDVKNQLFESLITDKTRLLFN